MPTSYTPLLGFALPAQGELSNSWGTVVNNSITSLVEDAVANSATADVTSANWTLTTTGSGLSNQARMAILIPTGTPGVSRNIIAPSYSKTYYVINQSNAAVVLKGAVTTGVSIAAGRIVLAAWNGTDFALVSSGVETVSVVTANGLAGTVGGTPTAPAITLSSTITGVLKANGTAISAAVSGTDYAPATSGSGVLKGNGAGGTATAVSGTDYAPATSGSGILKGNGAGGTATAAAGTDYAPATSGSGVLKGNGAGGTATAVSGTDYAPATSGSGVLKGDGAGGFSTATAGTDYVAPATATSFTAKQTFTGAVTTVGASLQAVLEKVNVQAIAATSTVAFNINTAVVWYYTTNASGNWTINIRGDASNSLNSLMAVGESMTCAFLVTQGSTAYYNSSVQIDATTSGVTTRWQGGTAPTAGNTSGIDVYSYTVIKTASATFTVLAALTQFK